MLKLRTFLIIGWIVLLASVYLRAGSNAPVSVEAQQGNQIQATESYTTTSR